MKNNPEPYGAPASVSRITGFTICGNAIPQLPPPGTDVVFLYDNSGSMHPGWAYIDDSGIPHDTLFYHDWDGDSSRPSGCADATEMASFTYGTFEGPRTVRRLSKRCDSTAMAGDPYLARGRLIRLAIDHVAARYPASTVAMMGFSDSAQSPQPLIPVDAPGNAQRLKDNVRLQSSGRAYYDLALRTAYGWLNDTVSSKNPRQIIVLISDGAPANNDHLALVQANLGVPIYSIYLGRKGSPDIAPLHYLPTITGGTLSRINPFDEEGIRFLLDGMFQTIPLPYPPFFLFTNTSLNPPQVSRAAGARLGPGSTIALTLDSILGLREGKNDIAVRIGIHNGPFHDYSLTIQTGGPMPVPPDTPAYRCVERPRLIMINQATGQPDSAYPAGMTGYTVRLTRPGNDLSQAAITAVSRDSAKPGWGDRESLILNLIPGTNPALYAGPEMVNGRSPNPIVQNGTLESDLNGELFLSWTHPRDPREFAIYVLPGRPGLPIRPPGPGPSAFFFDPRIDAFRFRNDRPGTLRLDLLGLDGKVIWSRPPELFPPGNWSLGPQPRIILGSIYRATFDGEGSREVFHSGSAIPGSKAVPGD